MQLLAHLSNSTIIAPLSPDKRLCKLGPEPGEKQFLWMSELQDLAKLNLSDGFVASWYFFELHFLLIPHIMQSYPISKFPLV